MMTIMASVVDNLAETDVALADFAVRETIKYTYIKSLDFPTFPKREKLRGYRLSVSDIPYITGACPILIKLSFS